MTGKLHRRSALGLTAGGLALASGRALAAGGPERPLVINALGGIEDPNPGLAKPPGERSALDLGQPDVNARAVEEAVGSGLTAVNITLGYVAGPMEPFEHSVRTIGVWDRVLRGQPKLAKVWTAGDILKARDGGKVGVIYGFQNSAMLGDDPSRVDLFADLGVRVFQLTYNLRNQLGDGSLVAENRGLTPFGHEAVARMNAARVMVDLSHSGQQICLDAARASKAPISINHTGCRALADLPRNKTDEELRLVAEKGGFVGIYFMPFLRTDGKARAADVVAHIEHAVNVCGEEHVGIGTDGGVTTIDDFDAYAAHLRKENAERVAAGVAAPGEGPEVYPFVVDLRGSDQFRKLAGMLRARGHSQARIDKIMGRNFLRYATDVWGA